MRRFRLIPIVFLAALAVAVPSTAKETAGQASAPANESSRLDELFADLKKERSERAARRIAQRIWEEWFDSGSATADLLMERANAAIQEDKNHVALDLLDQVVTLFPDYAEGWNRRATLHFTMNSYGKSMADISRTLELEPRHFGALSGMAGILRATGQTERALDAYERVLEIYPMMRTAQDAVVKLSDELAGEGI